MSQPSSRSTPSVTWLGHATVLIEVDGVRLLTDPVLGARIGPLVRIAPAVEIEALGRLDCVLLSHLHADHTHVWSLRKLAQSTPVVAPRGAAGWLSEQGISTVTELESGEEADLGGVLVRATPATHDSRRRPFGPEADAVGYLVSGSSSVYFAGDTDLFSEMSELRGCVDVALLPVWGWGPKLGPGHLDPERAARAASLIEPSIAIPIHWGTFALPGHQRARSDPDWPVRDFERFCTREAPAVEVRVLAPGDRTEFGSG
jgi:L-ascorbate metabolism protein UlaG (beta-lactamase superfamily)